MLSKDEPTTKESINIHRIGVLLRRKRIAKKITVRALAKAIKKSRQHIYYIEDGIYLPSLRDLRSICQILEFDFTKELKIY